MVLMWKLWSAGGAAPHPRIDVCAAQSQSLDANRTINNIYNPHSLGGGLTKPYRRLLAAAGMGKVRANKDHPMRRLTTALLTAAIALPAAAAPAVAAAQTPPATVGDR